MSKGYIISFSKSHLLLNFWNWYFLISISIIWEGFHSTAHSPVVTPFSKSLDKFLKEVHSKLKEVSRIILSRKVVCANFRQIQHLSNWGSNIWASEGDYGFNTKNTRKGREIKVRKASKSLWLFWFLVWMGVFHRLLLGLNHLPCPTGPVKES